MMKIGAVNTGCDGVVAFDFQDGELHNERIHWKLNEESYGADLHHLNSICSHEGRLLVSGFGKRETRLWSSAKNGFLIDIVSNEKRFEGLCQPHSLASVDGSLLVCESAKARVLNLSNDRIASVDGYVRGLCHGPSGIYVATSRGRSVSKSTGLVLTNQEDPGEVEGHAAIYLLDKETLEVKDSIDCGAVEIYDLISLDRDQ